MLSLLLCIYHYNIYCYVCRKTKCGSGMQSALSRIAIWLVFLLFIEILLVFYTSLDFFNCTTCKFHIFHFYFGFHLVSKTHIDQFVSKHIKYLIISSSSNTFCRVFFVSFKYLFMYSVYIYIFICIYLQEFSQRYRDREGERQNRRERKVSRINCIYQIFYFLFK